MRVTHVKAYRVVHETATARQVANGWDPFDPTLYQPFFFGDFLSDGTPDPGANVGFDQSDPFLFWLVPIIRQKSESSESQTPAPFGPKPSVRNYVLVHAGVPDDGRLP